MRGRMGGMPHSAAVTFVILGVVYGPVLLYWVVGTLREKRKWRRRDKTCPICGKLALRRMASLDQPSSREFKSGWNGWFFHCGACFARLKGTPRTRTHYCSATAEEWEQMLDKIVSK
jgi:hypothetical protein